MFYRSIIPFFIVTILILTNCHDNSTNPIDDSLNDTIIPLKVGNYWVYQSNEVGNINRRDTIMVTLKKQINGKDWYLFGEIYVRNEKDGLWMIDPEAPNKTPVLILKYPGKVGDQWNVSNDEKTKILSTDTGIEVLGKMYSHCYLYEDIILENGNISEKTKIYIKPGIGIVKTEEYNNAGGLEDQALLVLYKLN